MLHAALASSGLAIALLSMSSATLRAQFTPVEFPANTGVPGFNFPAATADIDKWVNGDDVASMAAHAWGLWVGLNMESGQIFNGQNLRIFETWNEKSELSNLASGPTAAARQPARTLTPRTLRQFQSPGAGRFAAEAILAGSPVGFVKFNPSAADHIVANKLLSRAALLVLVKPGQISNVPDFKPSAISIKVPIRKLVSDTNTPGFARLVVWPGPPSTPQAFGPNKWGSFVWVDLDPKKPSTGDGSVARGSDLRTPATTYSVNDFISFKDATGSISVVVGMHVTTREIAKWTWQTFWWTPNAANPPLPSSAAIASARPAKLLGMGAPAHYAVSLSYSMRTSSGRNVFGYNPYLEAGFSGLPGTFKFGVQTNCMSCHASAAFPAFPHSEVYVGDEVVDIADPKYRGRVRLDFLYSLEQP